MSNLIRLPINHRRPKKEQEETSMDKQIQQLKVLIEAYKEQVRQEQAKLEAREKFLPTLLKKDKEDGYSLLEFLVVLILVTIVTSIGMLSADKIKESSTKQEMQVLKHVCTLYELEEGQLPNNLSKLQSWFSGNKYKKDQFGKPYTYNKGARSLCSISIDTDSVMAGTQPYCIEL